MTSLQRLLLLIPVLAAFGVAGVGCPTGGDDDDVVADDDDVVGDDDDVVGDDDDSSGDDDDSGPAILNLAGEVTAVDRETGAALSDQEYTERGGPMIVYLTNDPADLSEPLAKFVLQTPGTWSTQLLGDGSDLFVVVVVDDNGNRIIEQTDMLREHPMNPRLLGTADMLDLDIVIDLAAPDNGGGGGGGGGDGPCTNIDGDAILLAGVSGEIAVTANSANLGVGPFAETYIPDQGPFSICVSDSREYTSLLGIHDTDGNGFFEPSDDIGDAQINPIALGIGDVIGAVIEIPSANNIVLPSPPPYVYLQGNVVFPGYTTGVIRVFVTANNTTYYSTVLPGPGGFAVRAPSRTDDVIVWAVVDEEADGVYDVTQDPYGQANPLDTLTFDVQGLLVSIVDPYDNSISGTVGWTGPADPGSVLHVALHDDPAASGAPVFNLEIQSPVFPQAYTIPELFSGTYYVTGYLDSTGAGGGAQPGDPFGFFGTTTPTAVVLSGGSHPQVVNFSLAN
jgi:hypothetical protein